MLSALHNLLFALSLILINPWGSNSNPLETSRAEIWTQPRILVVALIVFLNLGFILKHVWHRKSSLLISWNWKVMLCLWLLYLGSGIIATVLSPFPWHSLWGQAVIGDGLIYWILIAIFVLSNSLVLSIQPNLLQFQLYGLLFGGFILALSIFPQTLNWRIDYTATLGQISDLDPQLLASAIWQDQMPIGLYNNRGHAAFVLAGVGGLNLVALLRKWMRPALGIGICVITSAALFCTQTRAGILAFVVAITYLIIRFYSRSSIQIKTLCYVVGLLTTSFFTLLMFGVYRFFKTVSIKEIQQVGTFEVLEKTFTGRLYLWILALKGVIERPIWGWGFDGFGIAHLFVGDWIGKLREYVSDQPIVSHIVALNEFTFEYLGPDGQLYTGETLAHKAHNLILDTALSVGIVGLLSYCVLIGFCFWRVAKSALWGYEIVMVAYLTFTLTWFESAQFSHLPWWSLSLGLVPTKPYLSTTSNSSSEEQTELN